MGSAGVSRPGWHAPAPPRAWTEGVRLDQLLRGSALATLRRRYGQGYFIKRTDGSVWQTDLWQPGMAIVDFTNPAAREWFAGHITQLRDLGVDAIKTDFGERIPTDGLTTMVQIR